MSETWRKKTHYRHRVLISTARVLDPQYADGLICLTGAELEMLRNLTQYLHRRGTFAEDVTPSGYLSPSTADWDSVQAIVANLEEKLMGCEELMQIFEDMLAQLQCVCNKVSPTATDGGSVAPIIEDYLDDGTLIPDDPYSVDTEIAARRCAVAQLTYWQAWGWLTEVLQPVQENAMDIVVPLFLGVVSIMVGVTPLAIPAATVITIVSQIIDIWVEGSLTAVQNTLWANRDELICAVFEGLSYDYRASETRAAEVIATMTELSPIDRICMRTMFAPWAMALASKAHTQATDWAVANVSAGACDDCSWVYEAVHVFPPSPGDWTGGFPTYIGRWPGINIDENGYSPEFVLPSIVDHIDIEIQCKFTSDHPASNTVGYCYLEYQDVGDDWHIVGGAVFTTLEAAGVITNWQSTDTDKTVPRNDLRLHIKGQAGQTETDPWPLMPSYLRVKIYPHV